MAELAASAKKLGDILLKEGLINEDQFAQGFKEYEAGERPLSRVLIEMGAINEGTKIGILHKKMGCDLISLKNAAPRPDVVGMVPRSFCEKHNVIPLRVEDSKLVVAMDDPTDARTVRLMEEATSMTVKPYLARLSEIREAIENLPKTAGAGPRKASQLRKTLAVISLLTICLVPIAVFLGLLLYHPPFQKAYKELQLEPFEQGLIFLLGWSLWAIIAYWINDVIFSVKEETA